MVDSSKHGWLFTKLYCSCAISVPGGPLSSRIALFVSLVFVSSLCAQNVPSQATHTLKATPKTVAWGYYDAKATPVLRVKSGDTVQIDTLITNSPKRLEDAG